jgi:glycosyltransferase involved in cell wall biosynthesis
MPSNHVIFVLKDLTYFLSHRQDLANYLVGNGFSVSLVTDLQGRKSFPGQSSLANVCHLPFASAKHRPWQLVIPTLVFFRLLLTHRTATVFSITLPAVLISGLLCKLLNMRQIILFAGLGNLFHGRPNVVRYALRTLIRIITNKPRTSVIAQNDAIRRFLLGHSYAQDITLIYGSGIDANSFQAVDDNRRSDRPTVLFLGRLLKEKGVLEYIQAAKSALAAGYSADFLLAGRTDPLNPTSLTEAQLAHELKDQAHIRWLGQIHNVKELLASVDVVCLPSYHEGLPRTLLEGALMGCCLIATDIPGSNDIVIANQTGILVAPKSSQALADGLASVLKNPDKIGEFAANARAHVLQSFTNDTILPQYLNVISKQ